jgi:hypothetical protein
MKKLLLLSMALLSLSTFAQEAIEINSGILHFDGSEVLLARTNQSPGKVRVNLQVPARSTECVRTSYRDVTITSGAICGYNHVVRRVSRGRVCARKNPYSGECVHWREVFEDRRVAVPRTCIRPQSYCSQYGTVTSNIDVSTEIVFVDLPALGDTESDTILVRATQKSHGSDGVAWEIEPVQTVVPYKVKQRKTLGIFSKNSYAVEVQ